MFFQRVKAENEHVYVYVGGIKDAIYQAKGELGALRCRVAHGAEPIEVIRAYMLDDEKFPKCSDCGMLLVGSGFNKPFWMWCRNEGCVRCEREGGNPNGRQLKQKAFTIETFIMVDMCMVKGRTYKPHMQK